MANFIKESDGGNKILEWAGDVATTRKQVSANERKGGIQISYKPDGEDWVNEQYIGTTFTDTEWGKNSNWKQIPNQNQISELNRISYETKNSTKLNESESESDLDLSDGAGNVLLRLKNGHIKTLMFDSEDGIDTLERKESESDSDFDLTDCAGNVLLRLRDGHIKTLMFDSNNIHESSKECIFNFDFTALDSIPDLFESTQSWNIQDGKLLNTSQDKLFLTKSITLNERETVVVFSLESDDSQFGLCWKCTKNSLSGSFFSVTKNRLSIHEGSQDGDNTDVKYYNDISLETNRKYILIAKKILHENIVELIDGVNGKLISQISSQQTSIAANSEEFSGGRQMDRVGLFVPSGYAYIYKLQVINTIAKPLVVIYGDSITEGDRCYSYETYGYLLKKILGYSRVALSGASGTKIYEDYAGVYQRIENEITGMKNRPKYIMVTIGTNGGNSQEYFNNLKSLIEGLGCIPIINVPPMFSGISTVRDYILNLNCMTARFDIATSINNDVEQGADLSLFANDRLHPNGKGHIAMFNRMRVDLLDLFCN